MQMNQRVMFFSDGGTDVREVQQYLNPEAEHYLDWFHITMRLTVMGQFAKGLDTTQGRASRNPQLAGKRQNITCGMGMWPKLVTGRGHPLLLGQRRAYRRE
jgi:hypothetical protein